MLGANPTNLHTHGLIVEPRQATPSNPTYGDYVYVLAYPKGKLPTMQMPGLDYTDQPLDYDIYIPSNHPTGLFWIHPHVHGLAFNQISYGMAGIITIGSVNNIVEPSAFDFFGGRLIAISGGTASDIEGHAGALPTTPCCRRKTQIFAIPIRSYVNRRAMASAPVWTTRATEAATTPAANGSSASTDRCIRRLPWRRAAKYGGSHMLPAAAVTSWPSMTTPPGSRVSSRCWRSMEWQSMAVLDCRPCRRPQAESSCRWLAPSRFSASSGQAGLRDDAADDAVVAHRNLGAAVVAGGISDSRDPLVSHRAGRRRLACRQPGPRGVHVRASESSTTGLNVKGNAAKLLSSSGLLGSPVMIDGGRNAAGVSLQAAPKLADAITRRSAATILREHLAALSAPADVPSAPCVALASGSSPPHLLRPAAGRSRRLRLGV